MSEKQTVLVVDDDLDFLDQTRQALEARGYRVCCAFDPEAALEQMGREKPDLVIADLMMKSLASGFSFARQTKEDVRFQDVPVVIVTAIGRQRGFDFRPRTADELAAMRADAYMDKPVTPEALLATVRELLHQRPQEEAP